MKILLSKKQEKRSLEDSDGGPWEAIILFWKTLRFFLFCELNSTFQVVEAKWKLRMWAQNENDLESTLPSPRRLVVFSCMFPGFWWKNALSNLIIVTFSPSLLILESRLFLIPGCTPHLL